jgi:hypothetical protein
MFLTGVLIQEGVAVMQRFLVVGCLAMVFLADAMPGSKAVAAGAFPWFHTRPKPVVLDEPPSSAAPTVAQNRVPYRGTAVYPGSGRLYFDDAYDRRVQQEQPSKSRLTDVFLRGWRAGSPAPKTTAAKSK